MHIALSHRTLYQFDRDVRLGPHEIRLYPAPHCRTPILSYSLKVEPPAADIHWQTDSNGNTMVRLTFAHPSSALHVNVDLVADMTEINPFDFNMSPEAHDFPFEYSMSVANEMATFLATSPAGMRLQDFLRNFRQQHCSAPLATIELLVRLNRMVNECTRYVVRLEPGVQDPEHTLELGSGSCRDSTWLLIQALRHLGIAARFASGYLIQLKTDEHTPEGHPVVTEDNADLHAWAEAFIPGAGWIGLDTTSGLLAGEGHIPLACSPAPDNVAPVSGTTEPCHVHFSFEMEVSRQSENLA